MGARYAEKNRLILLNVLCTIHPLETCLLKLVKVNKVQYKNSHYKVKMSYSEDFGGTSNDDNDEIEDIEATNEQDNDYYSFLHVPRCATQDEIVAAYKKLSRLYHPDKHRDEEKKEYAGAMFTKLNQAYEVLRDPHKRALYDCLGKDGVAPDVLAVISRTKTPKEIRDEYERLAKV